MPLQAAAYFKRYGADHYYFPAIRRVPYTIRSSTAIITQISPSIEEAAISLGATEFKSFWKSNRADDASGSFSRSDYELDHPDQ